MTAEVSTLSSLREQAQSALDGYARTRLQSHGGDVVVESVTNDHVELRLVGACSGCPAAAMTFVGVLEPALEAACPDGTTFNTPDVTVSPHARQRIRRMFAQQRTG